MAHCRVLTGLGARIRTSRNVCPQARVSTEMRSCHNRDYSTHSLRVTSVPRLQQLLDNTVGYQSGMFCASWPSTANSYQGVGPDSFTSSPGYMPHVRHRIDSSSSRACLHHRYPPHKQDCNLTTRTHDCNLTTHVSTLHTTLHTTQLQRCRAWWLPPLHSWSATKQNAG